MTDVLPMDLPEPALPAQKDRSQSVNCLLDQKGRTVRHKPWAWSVGSGPGGKTCGDCAHLKIWDTGAKRFFKCGRQHITGGPGTDIRKKDQACALFEQGER